MRASLSNGCAIRKEQGRCANSQEARLSSLSEWNARGTAMSKPTIATIWLDGCSGCHMSFLDLDERLIELSAHFDLVYSPLVDVKTMPAHIDVALVEGSVSNEDDEH